MGKLICDSTATSSPCLPWRVPATAAWDDVAGLEPQQRTSLRKLHTKGVLWKNPADQTQSVVFRLSHGGDVPADGNCLFTAAERGLGVPAPELRRRAVRWFEQDFGGVSERERGVIESAIRNMYTPEVGSGWGVHVVQELKMLARKGDRVGLDSAIDELVQIGMLRESAAESIYKERCMAVGDGPSWAKYMSISGSPDDEYDIITLQYTVEGLLTVDENREGRAAAFGDDIAIECLATEFKREIYVVQAHGSDAMVDEENCLFFLPHQPRSEITGPPLFLLMKGTGWCGAGGDHYEPLIAHPFPATFPEKVAFVL